MGGCFFFSVEQLGFNFKSLLNFKIVILDIDNAFLKRQIQIHLCIIITDLGFAVVQP